MESGTSLYGETDPYRAEWVEAQTLLLLSRHTDQVIQLLEDKTALLAPSSQAVKSLRATAATDAQVSLSGYTGHPVIQVSLGVFHRQPDGGAVTFLSNFENASIIQSQQL